MPRATPRILGPSWTTVGFSARAREALGRGLERSTHSVIRDVPPSVTARHRVSAMKLALRTIPNEGALL